MRLIRGTLERAKRSCASSTCKSVPSGPTGPGGPWAPDSSCAQIALYHIVQCRCVNTIRTSMQEKARATARVPLARLILAGPASGPLAALLALLAPRALGALQACRTRSRRRASTV